jgi:Calcineurin-like phosphoesterase
MAESYKKFVALYDLHYGYERRNRHKISLHDPRAMDVALQFASDFKPNIIIAGGDILDCGAISHHNRQKPGRTEGLRVLADAQECGQQFIQPLNQLKAEKRHFIKGNHEAWLDQLVEDMPGLEGLLDLPRLLPLDGWDVIEQGGHVNLGKLTFLHGDQLSGGEHVAKQAVINYERSVRFGHFHSQQTYSKNTPFDAEFPKTGISVGCLCRKSPHYGKSRPNKWSQGFLYGYILPDGSYHDYPVTIVKGRAVVNGKVYHG